VIQEHISAGQVYGLKPAAARKLLRANPPRRTMKLLGYRSADSMLRQESPAALIAGACIAESDQWSKRLTASYAKLAPNDFETRPLTVETPKAVRWLPVADQAAAGRQHLVSPVRECGAVIVLPQPAERPQYATLLTAVLILHAINEVRSAGSYLKLEQMQAGFGRRVQQVAAGTPLLFPAPSLDAPVAWETLHRFMAQRSDQLQTRLSAPLLAAEELAWHSVEHVLASIEPTLEFWQATAHVGLLHRGLAVPLNMTDALLSHAGGLSFEQRLVQNFRNSLQHELQLRYLNHDKLEQTVLTAVQTKLAPEFAVAD
jgi:hypothetical protein